jgi:hypothetical protein
VEGADAEGAGATGGGGALDRAGGAAEMTSAAAGEGEEPGRNA